LLLAAAPKDDLLSRGRAVSYGSASCQVDRQKIQKLLKETVVANQQFLSLSRPVHSTNPPQVSYADNEALMELYN